MATAGDLVLQSYILANVKDANEELEGFEAAEGLQVLNDIIDQWSSLQMYIPTYNLINFDTEVGVYEYTVTPIITQLLEASYYDSNNVKFDLRQIFLKEQNLTNYQLGQTAKGHPKRIFLQDAQANVPVATTTVFLSPVPSEVFSVTLYAKQIMSELPYSDVILNIPRRCFKALKYQTAYELSIINSTVLSPKFDIEYDRIIREFKAANKKDMSVQNTNPFCTQRRFRAWSVYAG